FPSAAPTSGCSSGGAWTSLARPGPCRASETSRPSARASSSSALHGSVLRSSATDCDSRGDVRLHLPPCGRTQQRPPFRRLRGRPGTPGGPTAALRVTDQGQVRALYLDLDGTLLGRGASLLHDGEGAVSIDGVRAVQACLRADVEVVLMSGRRRAQVA